MGAFNETTAYGLPPMPDTPGDRWHDQTPYFAAPPVPRTDAIQKAFADVSTALTGLTDEERRRVLKACVALWPIQETP